MANNTAGLRTYRPKTDPANTEQLNSLNWTMLAYIRFLNFVDGLQLSA
jgi:hypothetical protein